MAWVRTIDAMDAEGELLEVYQKITGQEKPAHMANVLSSTSLRPKTLNAMMDLNLAVDFQNTSSGLSRLQLEMIATVVSASNECRY